MGRSDDFTAENTYGDNQVEQLFTQCGFAEQWIKDGMEEYGKLYCDVIDPAIAKGYSEDLECIHVNYWFHSIPPPLQFQPDGNSGNRGHLLSLRSLWLP
ncbi:L-2-amino-thiazoline-4-carboxylic acid hydrolase [Clostridium sp. WB02_MRS01]|uniref:L-2-amino-thiazoline-4-carboxylic acid hydrolase n=1 Tax=Clostridium sp. WB02_MRS01 TaxID=2605777 RepID=UPI00336BCFAE